MPNLGSKNLFNVHLKSKSEHVMTTKENIEIFKLLHVLEKSDCNDVHSIKFEDVIPMAVMQYVSRNIGIECQTHSKFYCL